MNYFLTGKKHLGKSTVRRRILALLGCSYGGFETVVVRAENGAGKSCHILPCFSGPLPEDFSPLPTEENTVFLCPRGETVLPALDRIAEAVVTRVLTEKPDVIVMDELGPAESGDRTFQALVTRCLDSEIPVLGVLQQCDPGWLDGIRARSDTAVFEVTEENRDSIAETVARNIREEYSRM